MFLRIPNFKEGLSNLKNNYFMVFKLMAFFAAGISPVPMISGGTPAVA